MAEDLGNQMVSDPSVADIAPDDEIISVGTETPPQETPEETPPTETPTTPESTTPPVEGQQPGEVPSQEPPTVPAAEAPPPVVNPWDTVLTTVKERTGVQFNDADQMVSELSAYQQYKQDPNAHLPAEIKAHMEFIKSGGDTNEFYRLKSQDFTNMSDREILFQSYLKANPEHAANMDFARIDFDRNYRSTYGILSSPKKTIEDFRNEDDEVDQQKYNDYVSDYQYWEQKIKVEGGIARKKLTEWQEQATTPQAHPQTGLTDDQARDFLQKHQVKAAQVKSTYKGEQFAVSDKPEENLNLGLSDTVRPQWESDIDNPTTLFKELGLNEDGTLDMERLKKTAFVHRIWPQLGRIVSKLVIEQQNRQTVVGQQVNPPASSSAPPNGSPTPGDAAGDDELQEVADKFLELQQQERAQGRRY